MMKKASSNRKSFLLGSAGSFLALPLLESSTSELKVPMRIAASSTFYGLMPDHFFPTEVGADYSVPTLLKPLEGQRKNFTIFSGLDHNMGGGHEVTKLLLSGIRPIEAKGFAERNISVDQKAALHVGSQTRFPSLVLGCNSGPADEISWTANGAQIQSIKDLDSIMKLLFHNPSEAQIKKSEIEYRERSSILDLVRTQARKFQSDLGKVDRDKLDQYFTSVRELEIKMGQSEEWLYRKKPTTNYKLPRDNYGMNLKQKLPLFYDLMTLALQTDSTRVVTLSCHGLGKDSGGLSGVNHDYHALSHHGKVQASIDELLIIESFFTSNFGRFLNKLSDIQEPNGKSMLDNTMALLGSGMSNANSHSNRNLPLLLAGGGFRHGEHKFYEKNNGASVELSNLYLTMLQRFGCEIDQFNRSTGTLAGFELA